MHLTRLIAVFSILLIFLVFPKPARANCQIFNQTRSSEAGFADRNSLIYSGWAAVVTTTVGAMVGQENGHTFGTDYHPVVWLGGLVGAALVIYGTVKLYKNVYHLEQFKNAPPPEFSTQRNNVEFSDGFVARLYGNKGAEIDILYTQKSMNIELSGFSATGPARTYIPSYSETQKLLSLIENESGESWELRRDQIIKTIDGIVHPHRSEIVRKAREIRNRLLGRQDVERISGLSQPELREDERWEMHLGNVKFGVYLRIAKLLYTEMDNKSGGSLTIAQSIPDATWQRMKELIQDSEVPWTSRQDEMLALLQSVIAN